MVSPPGAITSPLPVQPLHPSISSTGATTAPPGDPAGLIVTAYVDIEPPTLVTTMSPRSASPCRMVLHRLALSLALFAMLDTRYDFGVDTSENSRPRP